jgi:hypothetical protein
MGHDRVGAMAAIHFLFTSACLIGPQFLARQPWPCSVIYQQYSPLHRVSPVQLLPFI